MPEHQLDRNLLCKLSFVVRVAKHTTRWRKATLLDSTFLGQWRCLPLASFVDENNSQTLVKSQGTYLGDLIVCRIGRAIWQCDVHQIQ